MRRFEELRVWSDARSLVCDVYALTNELKDFGFKDQIQRAAVSVMNNIAEGAESGTDLLFIRFLNIAKGSCGEVRSMFYLADDLGYCDSDEAKQFVTKIEYIASAINNLIIYLKTQNNK